MRKSASRMIGCICFIAIALITGVILAGAAGGDSSDPVISKSYYDQNWTALKKDLEKKVDMMVDGDFSFTQQDLSKSTYKRISVPNGKIVIINEGSEVLLRGGSATAYFTGNGARLINTATGKELGKNATVPKNVILLSTANDGRGLRITGSTSGKTTAPILIKGTYTIK